MEKYLNMPIKAVISEFPKVGAVLQAYDIGCVTCGVGTCLLKDIIEIHNVSKAVEAEMMKRIEAVISGEAAEVNEKEHPMIQNSVDIEYWEPIQALVDEHKLIKRFLALVPDLCQKIESDLEENKPLVKQSVEFIKQFADKFHHAKEEHVLFDYAKGNPEIINVMLEDHKKGRCFVKSILLGLETEDAAYITYSLKHYVELLTEHIEKEDEILYPWLQKGMSPYQRDELSIRFDIANHEFGEGFFDKWKDFVDSLSI